MIFAAGYGKRLSPLTDKLPKPLLPIGKTCCLDLSLNALKNNEIAKIFINTHHLKNKIKEHIQNDLTITLIEEDEILETGGGLLNALDLLDDIFILINGDVWIEDFSKILNEMICVFDKNKMENLLLMIPKAKTLFYQGTGDYFFKEGKENPALITHKNFKNEFEAPYVFGGIQIWKKSAIQKIKTEKKHFSMRYYFDIYDKNKRLWGYCIDSKWCDIGNLIAYEGINNMILEKL